MTISISTSRIFPFLSSNIQASSAYGVFISQPIGYARACSSYGCFILRATRLSNTHLEQKEIRHGTLEIVIEEVLWLIQGSYKTIWSPPHTTVKWHSTSWPYTMTTHYRSDFIPSHDFINELDLLPNFWVVSIEHLWRLWHADRWRLLLRTPCPVLFGTCIYFLLRPIVFRTCRIFSDYAIRISLGTFSSLLREACPGLPLKLFKNKNIKGMLRRNVATWKRKKFLYGNRNV